MVSRMAGTVQLAQLRLLPARTGKTPGVAFRPGGSASVRLSRIMVLTIVIATCCGFVIAGCGGSLATSTTAATVTVATTTSLITIDTQVVTGTTEPNSPAVTRALTLVGTVSKDLWQTLRATVMEAGDDGQAVLDGVKSLSAGDPVLVASAELDSLSGIGFSAGAASSQPIAIALIPEGGDALVFAFTVPAEPEQTTIVGFQRGTGRVVLVEGPLPVDDFTQNITTVPKF
jgi:hypothetical protein